MEVVLHSNLCPVMSRKIRGFEPIIGGPDLYMVLFRYPGGRLPDVDTRMNRGYSKLSDLIGSASSCSWD